MLNIILNRLKPQEEKITAKKQEGFTAGRSTTEIFNLRILCRKYRQHQQDFYYVFIRLQEGFRQGLACRYVGNNEEVKHQHQTYSSYQKPL